MSIKTISALAGVLFAIPGLCVYPILKQSVPTIPPFQLSNITIMTRTGGAVNGSLSTNTSLDTRQTTGLSTAAPVHFDLTFQVTNFAINTSASCALSFDNTQLPSGNAVACGISPQNDTTYEMSFNAGSDPSSWQADSIPAFQLSISSAFVSVITQVLADLSTANLLITTKAVVNFTQTDFQNNGHWNDAQGNTITRFFDSLKISYPSGRNTTGWTGFGQSSAIQANSVPYNNPVMST